MLFVLPRFHTNAVGWVRLLQAEGHEVAMLVQSVGASEDHSRCQPIVVSAQVVTWRNMASSILGQAPDTVIVRGLTRRFCRMAALVAMAQRRRVVVYDQEDPLPPGFSGTWFRRAGCRLLGLGRMTARASQLAVHSLASATTVPFAARTASDELFAAGKERIAQPLAVPKILMVGKYRARKGHAELIDALGQLGKAHDFQLTFCGEEVTAEDRDFRRDLQARCEARGLASRTQFLANLELAQMMALYARHQIFVLPSRDEPAAVSPIEAIWNGCAALVDHHSGTRHYLPPGDAYACDARDPGEIANRLQSWLASRDTLLDARRECLTHLTAIGGDEAVLAAMRECGVI